MTLARNFNTNPKLGKFLAVAVDVAGGALQVGAIGTDGSPRPAELRRSTGARTLTHWRASNEIDFGIAVV